MADYRQVLQQMHSLWPQFDIDGVHNMWIVKPGDKSKGVGKYSALYMPTRHQGGAVVQR